LERREPERAGDSIPPIKTRAGAELDVRVRPSTGSVSEQTPTHSVCAKRRLIARRTNAPRPARFRRNPPTYVNLRCGQLPLN